MPLDQEAIAVVGLAGRFPMAADVDELWLNLVSGRECVHELDDRELLARGETPERLRNPSYVRRRPLLEQMEDFDAELFAMTGEEAELRDPQHRLFLESCATALEHGGQDASRHEGSVGVFGGTNAVRYADLHVRGSPGLVAAVGGLAVEASKGADSLAAFAAYKLGLRGPAVTVAAAGATSLVAIHAACRALRAGDCDLALAGGAAVEWPYGLGYLRERGSAHPPDGRSRPFDVGAAGTVFGSGVAVVLLKRHADAVADRDTVYALVRGSALTSDGARRAGFTVPSVAGRAACVVEALHRAGAEPATIGYVEADGAATPAGDATEIRALAEAYRLAGGAAPAGSCGIGSVKSNLGHLGAAAGVAGFVKTVLALHRELIPPSVNFREPSPELRLEETPFRVVAELRDWPRTGDGVRRAGVSACGLGGTNVHAILEEAPALAARAEGDGRPELLLFSAATGEAAGELGERLARRVASAEERLADVAHTLRVGRRAHAVRGAAVGATAADAAEALAAAEPAEAAAAPWPLVFAFPGQGAQSVRMAHGLYELDAGFRGRCDACFELLAELLAKDLRAIWLEGPAELLAETAVAQPVLYAIEYALAGTLVELAGAPDAVLGHSLGELVAGGVAGVFSFEDGLRVVAERGRVMQSMPRGAMLAVSAALEDVERLIPAGVAVAAVNTRRQVVLSGGFGEIAAAEQALRDAEISCQLLRTSHAYHSPLMAEAADRFREFLRSVPLAAPRVPLLSAARAGLPGVEAADPAFWADQLVEPVRFADAAGALFDAHPGCVVLEVGPGTTIANLLRAHPGARATGAVVRPVLGRAEPGPAEYAELLAALGFLWQRGRDLEWSRLDDGVARRVPLPTYPYERRRFFVDRPTEAGAAALPREEGPAPDAVAPPG